MSQRTQALVISLALLIGLVGWYSSRPGEFALFSPGPTVNLLGTYDGKQIIAIDGRKTYRDDGELRLVTIRTTRPEDRVGLVRALQAWADPDVDVYPYRGIYDPEDTNDSTREQSAQQMTSSQNAAVAAALTQLGIDYRTQVGITTVDPTGPSDGVLRPGDRLVSVAGAPARSTRQVVQRIKGLAPGTEVELVITRGERRLTRTVTTAPSTTTGPGAKQSRIGVGIEPTFDFPLEVTINLDEAIGGPSAGMMFALSIVDLLTPGSLTGGRDIAGTGEIDPQGRVGSIGGVQQKISGAQADGARLFLVPEENCAEAVQGSFDPDRITLARVATLEEAVDAIESWVADPEAELPSCRQTSSDSVRTQG